MAEGGDWDSSLRVDDDISLSLLMDFQLEEDHRVVASEFEAEQAGDEFWQGRMSQETFDGPSRDSQAVQATDFEEQEDKIAAQTSGSVPASNPSHSCVLALIELPSGEHHQHALGGSQADRAERGEGGLMGGWGSEASGLISGESRGDSGKEQRGLKITSQDCQKRDVLGGDGSSQADGAGRGLMANYWSTAVDQYRLASARFTDRSDNSLDVRAVASAIASHAPAPASSPLMPTDTSRFAVSCLVCFDTIQQVMSDGGKMMSDLCGHVICSSCLDTILKDMPDKQLCPGCRKKFNKHTLHGLFFGGRTEI